jgi:hypothetical protein
VPVKIKGIRKRIAAQILISAAALIMIVWVSFLIWLIVRMF